jgi:nucleoside-diphosphate-sugar epimerase
MKILVTGEVGVIWSNIADALLDKGHDVIIFDNSSDKKENVDKKIKKLNFTKRIFIIKNELMRCLRRRSLKL